MRAGGAAAGHGPLTSYGPHSPRSGHEVLEPAGGPLDGGWGAGMRGTLVHGYSDRAGRGGYGAAPADHVHAVVPAEAPSPSESWQQRRSRPSTGAAAKGLAVLFCDLDGFKSVNDRFGHNAGDAVLVEVARRLQQAVREGDTVARLGGDEFVVLADGIGSEEAADLAVRLRNAVVPPMRIAGRVVRVGVSMGIGWAGCGMSIEEVLHAADKRMYDEKRARGGAVRGARGERSHRRAV